MYLSPTPSFNNSQRFLSPFFPVYPALLPLLLPLHLILLMSLSTTISLLTVPLHPSSCMHHPPHLFTPPVIPIKPQFNLVMGICTFHTNSEATCAFQGNLVLFVCNTSHASLTVYHRQFNASQPFGILSLTCGLRQCYVLSTAPECTD